VRRLLIIGCGDIGRRVAHLLRSRYRIYALTRDSARASELRTLGITPIIGDLDRPKSLSRLSGLAQLVLHFAPPQNSGAHDLHTRNLLTALNKSSILPHRLVFISTSGVYGDCSGALVRETQPVRPMSGRAQRRADAEKQIRAWGRRNGVCTSILRVPGIYGAGRLPVERVLKGTPALRPEEDVYTNHIHADDLARVAVAALHRGRPGRIYNAGDDVHMKMADYFDMVADHYGLPHPPRISWVEAQQQLSPGLLSFMAESRRLDNTRIKHELGVKLRYPDVPSALREIDKNVPSYSSRR
jgi:nucleoside-diphosphate-sugar epimerase